jgi:YcaO-like protein with predicted kinase domain
MNTATIGNVSIEAYPSNHMDAMRSLKNPKFILLDEADFFRKGEQENARHVSERYVGKSDPYIIMVSTPNFPLLVKNITQEDIGIPTLIASSAERVTSDYGFFYYGHGTHPDSRIALIRAITEVSQNRAGNIQGTRDDLKNIKFNEADETYKRKWQFMPASNNYSIKFSEIKSYINKDILEDIKFILSRLKNAEIKRAIIVDLTNPEIGIPVVRAIVPGLETFSVSQSIMGPRAKNYFKRKILK